MSATLNTPMTDREWQDQLRAGDDVIVSYRNATYARTVLRRDKLRIHVQHGTGNVESFGAKSGRSSSGDGPFAPRLMQPTPALLQEARDNERRAVAKRRLEWALQRLKDIPLDKLEEAARALTPADHTLRNPLCSR
jgi:hypothetical protein